MNKIEFEKYDRFPADLQMFSFLQAKIDCLQQFGYLGSKKNYIVSGDHVSGGWVFIAGELLPLAPGNGPTVYIAETFDADVQAEGQVFSQVYSKREVRFGIGVNSHAWSSFETLDDLLTLKKALVTLEQKTEERMPSGAIIMWAGNAVPTGWVLCDGTNGTPNLIGKFVLGSHTSGTEGGRESHEISNLDLPPHYHYTVSTQESNSDQIVSGETNLATLGRSGKDAWSYILRPGNVRSSSDSAGQATLAPTSDPIIELGHSQWNNREWKQRRIEIIPPYYTLAYIQKL